MGEAPTKIEITNASVPLSLLAVGNARQPCVVMVHGLRDTAYSLLPVAQALAQPSATHPGFYVLICELRGHGGSARSDGYAMANFLADLHCVINAHVSQHCALFGHSLGGHLVSRYAALFPEQIAAVVMVEGLGPPQRPQADDEQAVLTSYRNMLVSRVFQQINKPPSKPIKDLAEVCQRLLRNNPRLPEDLAQQIAPHLVQRSPAGLTWAFDSRASSVFLSTDEQENARFWRQLQAPTCLISGSLSYEYWGREMATIATGATAATVASEEATGHFAEGEMEARLQHFKHAEHHWFDKSGHMVHYDEPARLANTTRNFLEKHHV